jgi:hypothetical protein
VIREAVVDLALLDRGFHIVTGPVPTDTDGSFLQQWNALYKYPTDAKLSSRPVIAGAGARPEERAPGRSKTPAR